MSLRLGFHYHVPAVSETEGIFMPGFQGVFVDSLASYCDQVICFLHSPLPAERPLMEYRLTSPNVTLVNIGPHVSVPRRLATAPFLLKPVRNRRQELDAILLRGPSPLLAPVARAAAGVPSVLLLVGDHLKGVDDLAQPFWRKEAIRLMWRWNYRQQLRLARRSLTFVNSRILYDQLRPYVPELHETRTTNLTKTDFFYRENTCAAPPYHLLYTGRLDRTKGLLEMVTAMAELVTQGEDVVLDLVGWPQKNDPILDEIMQLAQEKGVGDRITYHGYKAMGPELFAFYKKADVYLIASTHEGFPRTIWEAMAHSLPVVATKVGSIPHFLRHGDNALLVRPKNSAELAAAIRCLIGDASLRSKLIGRGMELARENTLETQTKKLVEKIKDWVANAE